MTANRTVSDFEVIDHGIMNSQYFQGCGTSFTDYEDVATGIGNDFAEALDDALESLAQMGWDTEGITSDGGNETVPEDAEECYYHVSVCVKGEPDDDEPTEPDEDDYTTSDHRHFYQFGKLVLVVPKDVNVWAYLDDHMERENFYPNVWFISDHGNAHLMTREG